jgi:hypothetical protein
MLQGMKCIHDQGISDAELRSELEARDSIVFMGTDLSMQDIERQVERLGFGEDYIVSEVRSTEWSFGRIRVQPK